ncbi:hypothetical protein RJ640_012883 [Escallonia rubra]|uniref:FAE domain-containing protein n=1 Tax=Escallonia rubra TaxID=112253 RepID=A0AA88UI50_9ASTE|nr:hypothetical protein RJ640_012883 [Escallonia rubra]
MPSSLPLSTAQLQFDDTNIDFQTQILEKSGFSEETCLHPSLCRLPRTRSLSLSIEEAATVMFSMVAAAWVAGKACLRAGDDGCLVGGNRAVVLGEHGGGGKGLDQVAEDGVAGALGGRPDAEGDADLLWLALLRLGVQG